MNNVSKNWHLDEEIKVIEQTKCSLVDLNKSKMTL